MDDVHVDRTSVRMRVSRLLATADVEPPSVPPSSILIVRTMADPARGELLRDGNASLASPRWVNAARDRLADLYRRASRPAHGPTSASALSVVFRDHAELLACLARDALSGNVIACWWWQAWARAAPLATFDDVIREWCRGATSIPAAFAILRAGGLAATFAGALSARQARTVFVAMTEAYEIQALAAPTPAHGLDLLGPPAQDPSRPDAPPAVSSGEPAAPATTPTRPVTPPWAPIVPPSVAPATLGLEARTLLGVALALERMPLVVRTRRFQHDFHAWRRAEQFGGVAPVRAPARTAGSTSVPPIVEPSSGAAAADERLGPLDPVRTSADVVDTPSRWATSIEQATAAAPAGGVPSGAPPSAAARKEETESPAQVSPALDSPASDMASRPRLELAGSSPMARDDRPPLRGAVPVEAATPERDAAMPVPFAVLAARTVPQLEAIHTELGGVLFLINAVKHLELFERLDDHFGVTESISGWGWLEILGRALLGPERAAAATDPLWRALAAIDGRDGPPDLTVFTHPRTHTLPASWVVANQEIATTRATDLLGQQTPRPLQCFLDVLVPYLRWRLLESMSLGGAIGDEAGARLAARLLGKRGRLTCTGTHVDLHMGMAQVDIAVRMAGLDANPGWVPALGRVVTFHYEQEIA